METMVETIKSMNEMLKGDAFPAEQFEALAKAIQEQFYTKFRVLDFEYYDEQRLAWAQAHKVKSIKEQSFEASATCRDLELECQKYIELRKRYDLKESTFFQEESCLLYLYFGNQRHDKEARLCINKYL